MNYLGDYHVWWNELFNLCPGCVEIFIDAERAKIGLKGEREVQMEAFDVYCKKVSALVREHGVEKARGMI